MCCQMQPPHQEEIGAAGAETRGERRRVNIRGCGSDDIVLEEPAASEAGEEDLWQRRMRSVGEGGGGREGGRGAAAQVAEEELGL